MGIVTILVISGWILTSVSESVGVDYLPKMYGIRAGIEINNSSNECTPDVFVNNNPATIYLNNGSITINITVVDADEVNNSIGASEPNNGTDIDTVSVDLSALGGSTVNAMTYNALASSNLGYNTSRFEGIWEFTLSLIGFEPSNYTIYFNATDNGNSLGAFKLSNNTESYTIKIAQYNRAPLYVGPPTLMYILDEDSYNNDPYEIDLTALFADADVDNGPFNNTPMDSLSFSFWDGAAWYTGTGVKTLGESFTMQRSGGIISILTLPNKFNASVPINFSATDSNMEMAMKQGAVTINSVNDAPMLNDAIDWINNLELNSTINLDGTIWCFQGGKVDMNVTASDIDSNILNFGLEGYNISNTSLTKTLFEAAFIIDPISGNFNFIPTNDWVGTFEINISVNDGFESDAKVFTFLVNNANDEPKIITVNDVAISNNALALRGPSGARQDEKFNLIVEAADIDLDIGIKTTLRFAATSKVITINNDGPFGETKWNFSFTPDNDNAIVGYVLVNISVKDHAGSGVDDWVIVNISIENVNDPPRIRYIDNLITPYSKFKDMGEIKVYSTENVSLVAEDIDGDNLYWTTNVTQATVHKVDNDLAILTFSPRPGDEGWVIVNVTVKDRIFDWLIDWVELKWIVLPDDGEEEPPPIPPINHAPTLSNVTGPSHVKIGEKIVITGHWADEDGDDIYLMSEITFPDGKHSTMGVIYFTSDDLTGDFPIYEYVDIEDDGTFTYTFDTRSYKQIYDAMVKEAPELLDLIGGKITKGTITFKLVAVDSIYLGAESDEVIHTVELNGDEPPPPPQPNGSGNGDGDMASSMGLFPYDIVIIPTIIILIILTLAVTLISRKKRKGYAEYEDTQQYYWGEPQPPAEGETYTEYDTTYKEQPSTYPEYGAPAQPPEEIPPPPPPPSTQQSYYPPYYDSSPPPSEAQPPGKLIGIMSELPPGHEKCITCEAIIPKYALSCPSCGTPVLRNSPKRETSETYEGVPEDPGEKIELPEDEEHFEKGREDEDIAKSY